VCETFSVKGTNFSQDFAEIRKRAGDRTIFLDCLKKELMKYMEQLDTK
jgi:hypothetical protein